MKRRRKKRGRESKVGGRRFVKDGTGKRRKCLPRRGRERIIKGSRIGNYEGRHESVVGNEGRGLREGVGQMGKGES